MKKEKLVSRLGLVIALILAALCGGCSFTDLPTGDALFVVHGKTNGEVFPPEPPGHTGLPPGKEEPVPYTVLYEAPELKRAVYEPPSGCYTGALINEGTNIREFNRDIKHAVYVFDMELGTEPKADWMLSCISAQATPLVLLHPKDGKMNLAQISRAAGWLGKYNLPMFVSFYPVSPDMEITPEAYKVYFRHAHSLLKMLAPKAATVWLADADAAFPTEAETGIDDFYPGHDVVDWVGLMGRDGWEEKEFKHDILGALDEFYMTYQKDKPVMLGPFGVSHFSDTDYIYYTTETAGELRRIYTEIRNEYPRVKLIAYADVNLIPQGGHHDFSFSQDEELSAAYTDITTDGYFIKKLEESGGTVGPGWLRSAAAGSFTEGKAQVANCEVKDIEFIIPDHGKKVLYVYAER